MELPSDLVREVVKYTPWSSRIVSKDFNRFINEDNERYLKMILNNETQTPFFNDQKFISSLPFSNILKSLKIVDCAELVDIKPLAKCTSLIELDLANSYIKDIAPLAHCKSLKKLDLSMIIDLEISPLAHCTTLTDLNLNECYWTDDEVPRGLNSLSKCVSLQKIDISCQHYTFVDIIKPLLQCAQLTHLFACTIKDMDTLSRMTSLQCLSFSDIGDDMKPLSKLTALHTLDISNDELIDITPLTTLQALSSLTILSESLFNISPLSKLVNLEYLVLYTEDLGGIEPLIHCKSLKKLSLSECINFIDIQPLIKCDSLEELQLIACDNIINFDSFMETSIKIEIM